MSRFTTKLVAFMALLIFASCAKKITEGPERLPRVKEKDLMEALDSISLRKPTFFYSKLDTKFDDGDRTVNFKTSIRLKVDSALNAIITYAKIPMVTAMVTKDSVTITNKRDKCYILEDLNFFKNNFGIDFKFKNIEEILLGLPLDYNIDDKYFQMHDPFNYIVSSHRKRDIKRTERGKIEGDILIKYFLAKDLKSVKRLEIESVEDSTNVIIDYVTRQSEKNYLVPAKMNVMIQSPKKTMFIEMDYEKVEIDEPKELFIVIPESYEKCD